MRAHLGDLPPGDGDEVEAVSEPSSFCEELAEELLLRVMSDSDGKKSEPMRGEPPDGPGDRAAGLQEESGAAPLRLPVVAGVVEQTLAAGAVGGNVAMGGGTGGALNPGGSCWRGCCAGAGTWPCVCTGKVPKAIGTADAVGTAATGIWMGVDVCTIGATIGTVAAATVGIIIAGATLGCTGASTGPAATPCAIPMAAEVGSPLTAAIDAFAGWVKGCGGTMSKDCGNAGGCVGACVGAGSAHDR